ncbi:hypothetical protein B0H16DRAFT_1747871 [Mycena metata]|uniref:Uncharacterized protein n=1 Tax=Mycena metata TaxID=1033252 RepID=A0AAD7M6K8_9AGAR|nr:hypothetical protein B0H16DRAFT_1747871 [Mycena metata]
MPRRLPCCPPGGEDVSDAPPEHHSARNLGDAKNHRRQHKAPCGSNTVDASAALPQIRTASSPNFRRISVPTSNSDHLDRPAERPHTYELFAPHGPNTDNRRERIRATRRSESPTPASTQKKILSPTTQKQLEAELQDGEGLEEQDPNEQIINEGALSHTPPDLTNEIYDTPADELMTDPRDDEDPDADTWRTAGDGGNAGQRRPFHDDRQPPPRGGGGDDGVLPPIPPPRVEEPPRAVRPLPFVHPTEAQFLLRPPVHRSRSPHKKNPIYDLPLTGPDDMPVKVSFQPTEGNLDRPIIGGKLMAANPEAFIDTFNKNPDDFGWVTPFLGGRALFEAFGPENLVAAIQNVLFDAGLAGPDDIEVIPLGADKKTPANDLYGPPFALALRASDTILELLATIATYIATQDLAFHIVCYNPGLCTWTLALYTASSMGGDDSNEGYLRWCLAAFILDDMKLRRAFQRATGTADKQPILTRLLDWARTVYVVWNPHSKHWCAYAEPCTPDYEGWESVRVTIRAEPLRHAPSLCSFNPVAADGARAPLCLNCKNDDHLHYGCATRLDDPTGYWGPKQNLGFITEGILAKASKTSGGGGTQTNAGGSRGGRGNPRGGGNRGASRSGGSQRR